MGIVLKRRDNAPIVKDIYSDDNKIKQSDFIFNYNTVERPATETVSVVVVGTVATTN